MLGAFVFQKPITEPVYIFLVMLLVIFFAPKVLKFLRIPGIVGFILAGVALGNNGFNIIGKSSGIELFSTIGLLYIMFLIGLEIDLVDFRKNRSKVFVFGSLTFFVPLILGFFVCRYLIHLDFIPALLLASMFSTHTMISYPIVSRLGLARHRITNIVAGGTIVTDTAVLLLLAIIVNTVHDQSDPFVWLRLIISLTLLIFVLFWLLPRISKWLFRKLEGDSGGQYLLLLIVLFIAGYLASQAGIEPMIGAFLAGIAMNRLVPAASSLMGRTVFIGNTLFIPFFLVSVGMVVDMRIFIQGHAALSIAIVLIITALISKFVAAWITQLIFRYKPVERNLMFGLSASHAAATIALVLVGFNLGLLDINVLNGTVAVIFISCLVSGFVTEGASKRIVIRDHVELGYERTQSQRILVPVANPATMRQLLNFAVLIKDSSSAEPIYPLSVIIDEIDSPSTREQLLSVNNTVEQFLKESDRPGVEFFPVTRVDLNVANGVNRAIKELMITNVVLGWNGKTSTVNFIFGNLLGGILPRNNQMIAVANINKPIYSKERIVVIMPPNCEYEVGFKALLGSLANLSKQLSAKVIFVGTERTIKECERLKGQLKTAIHAEFHVADEFKDLSGFEKYIRYDDLAVFISARARTLSYSNYVAQLPRNLTKIFPENDFVIIYPEQAGGIEKSLEIDLTGREDHPSDEIVKLFEDGIQKDQTEDKIID